MTRQLTIDGDVFHLDGRPIDLWGIRTASGTASDVYRDHLIDQLDEYLAHGVNAVTVFYMGCRGANYDPFSSDGRSVDADHQRRMEAIIQACDERGMVVVAGIFYQHAPFGLKDGEAVHNAVRTVTGKLKPYRNVIINIANEQNSHGYRGVADVFAFNDPERIIDLCRVVHEVDPERIVGSGGYEPASNEAIGPSPDVDVLLFDTGAPDTSQHATGALYERYRDAGTVGKPMVNVELFGGWTGKFPRGVFDETLKAAYIREIEAAAARPGLSIFFHNNPWCQSTDEPMRFDLGGYGTPDDPGIRWYFEAVRTARENHRGTETQRGRQ
ncbi:MAG: hypothetical protein WD009_12705 [Phycisphaeraceae bacterium]